LSCFDATKAELVDALASGVSGSNPVEVRNAGGISQGNQLFEAGFERCCDGVAELEQVLYNLKHAAVVELVDTLASGVSVRKDVEVQVLSAAPLFLYYCRDAFFQFNGTTTR
jgi:hypothetical protein